MHALYQTVYYAELLSSRQLNGTVLARAYGLLAGANSCESDFRMTGLNVEAPAEATEDLAQI